MCIAVTFSLPLHSCLLLLTGWIFCRAVHILVNCSSIYVHWHAQNVHWHSENVHCRASI